MTTGKKLKRRIRDLMAKNPGMSYQAVLNALNRQRALHEARASVALDGDTQTVPDEPTPKPQGDDRG